MAAVATRNCESVGCGQPAKLQCPTCIKLGIHGSFFCSQDCFKQNWNEHKKVHKTAKAAATIKDMKPVNYNPWPGYKFTGVLRPWPKSPRREVPDHIQKPDYAETGVPLSEIKSKQSMQIKVLNEEEIEKMRVACRLAREVMDTAARNVKVGITTDELDRIVHEACLERNCYPSPLNYHGFPKSCCTSVNEVICHGIPDLRPLENGDLLNIDITIYYNGFHGDLNETYFVGEVDEESKQLVKVTYECINQAIAAVKPGVKYREIGNIIQKHAQAHGFSVVKSYCGHGIHELFHTAPSVPHYSKNKAVGVMKPGHTFTIEPMISQGTWRDEIWPDNWTAVTQDGKRSAQFEQTLLVTDIGCDILTLRPDDNGRAHFLSQM
ncbi:methionine aminopeptidase 1-like [Orbicella faveolata]|uniref:methionine aminopeptidase 1-like n=1 Tax=Orbicella faveolata TaxID=48498 RepID=UPI0009E3A8AE|nr:methionine aminopeptidase 1-like [Orbicella faveolata]